MSPRVIVITGASAGVGRVLAREFAREGAKVGLIARGVDRLIATQAEIERLGGRAIALPTDVAKADQVEASAQITENTFGPIDVWVNNAMASVFSPAHEMLAEEYARVTEVTYLGYVYGTLSALKRMRPRDRGVIIQVGSALAYRSIPLQSAYCAAKHAINGFTESVRCELIHERSRVKVCSAHLPAMNTPQFDWVKSRLPGKPQPVPPIFQPEVAAQGIAWLSRHPRREIWVGGPTALAILAEKVFPGIADRYLGRTGYQSQQTPEPDSPGRLSNLWNPLPGDPGAHGRFDQRSKNSSIELWMATHRMTVIGLIALLARIVFLIFGNKSPQNRRRAYHDAGGELSGGTLERSLPLPRPRGHV
jgi:NAD(P)-dependent dehydrogenase (short-subunit alcohol dehydrogenase family)